MKLKKMFKKGCPHPSVSYDASLEKEYKNMVAGDYTFFTADIRPRPRLTSADLRPDSARGPFLPL